MCYSANSFIRIQLLLPTDQAGEQEMIQQNLQNIRLKTASPIEGHAAAVFTPYAFSKLQDELVASAQYASFHLEGSIFLVRHHTKEAGGCSVTWNQREELISCCCQMFKSVGRRDPLSACPSRAHSTELFPDPRPVPSCPVAQESATAFQLLEWSSSSPSGRSI